MHRILLVSSLSEAKASGSTGGLVIREAKASGWFGAVFS
jgi:hypothetical protein